MLLRIGLICLAFLPIIESFNRNWGLTFLFLGSLAVFLSQAVKKKLVFDFIDLVWIVFLSSLLASFLYTWSIINTYSEFLRYLSYFLVFYSIVKYKNVKRLVKKWLFPSILFNSLILSFLSLIHYISGSEIFRPVNSMNLFYPYYGHNRVASLLIIAIPVIIYSIFLSKNKRKLLLNMFILLFFLLTMVFSSGRGSLIALGVSIYLFVIIYEKKLKHEFSKHSVKINLIFYSILIVQICVLILLILSFAYSNFFPRGDYGSFINSYYKPFMGDQRITYFMQALEGIVYYPFTGIGLNSFAHLSQFLQSDMPFSYSYYAHNHFLQLYAELGFVGGSIFIILLSLFIISAVIMLLKEKDKRKILYKSVILVAIFASILHSFIDYDWQYISLFLYLWIFLALLQPKHYLLKNVKVDLKRDFINITILLYLLFFLIRFEPGEVMKEAQKYVDMDNIKTAVKIVSRAKRFDSMNMSLQMEYNWLMSLMKKNKLKIQ